MAVDLEPRLQQLESLYNVVGRLPIEYIRDHGFALVKPDQFDRMLGMFEERLSAQGREERLCQIGAQLSADPADAEMAFSLAAAVAVADDRVDVEEGNLVGELAEFFGISPKRATALLDEVTSE